MNQKKNILTNDVLTGDKILEVLKQCVKNSIYENNILMDENEAENVEINLSDHFSNDHRFDSLVSRELIGNVEKHYSEQGYRISLGEILPPTFGEFYELVKEKLAKYK